MEKEEIKIVAESMVEMSKMAVASALNFIQKGLEAYKTVEIPVLSSNDNKKYIPYRDDKGVRTFVDFMLVYLDEAIKGIDNKDKSE